MIGKMGMKEDPYISRILEYIPKCPGIMQNRRSIIYFETVFKELFYPGD